MEIIMKGKIIVTGIGPGGYEDMTIRAVRAISDCDVIVGYTVYTELIRKVFREQGNPLDKEIFTTPMKKETERARIAFEQASEGRTVCMVCSGDSGVYGMAGLIYELSTDYPDVDIEIISGVTAALSGGALLGAPISHDFSVISLSDLLTPWDIIEKRLEAAASSDMVICLYNPASRKRTWQLNRACRIMLKYKDEGTVCGAAISIGRDGERYEIMTLKDLAEYKADMFTTIFIGNSQTEVIAKKQDSVDSDKGKNDHKKMVTPRGYRLE